MDRSTLFLTRLASIVICIFGLHYSKWVLAPLLVAILLAVAINPMVIGIERRVRSRALALALSCCLIIGGVVAVGAGVLSQVNSLRSASASYQQNASSKISAAIANVENLTRNLLPLRFRKVGTVGTSSERVNQTVSEMLVFQSTSEKLFAVITLIVSATLHNIAFILTVVVFTLLFLAGREGLRNRVIQCIGMQDLPRATQVISQATKQVEIYLAAQLTCNLLFGACLTIALICIGIPQALLWGALAAVLRFVPYVGGFLGIILPVLLSVSIDQTWLTPLLTLSSIALLELCFINVIEPRIMGQRAGLSQVGFLVAIAFWAGIWGVTGILIAAPLTISLVCIARYIPSMRILYLLLSDDASIDEATRVYQRLLAKDQHEAERIVDMLTAQIPASEHLSHLQVYEQIFLPVLRMATFDLEQEHFNHTEFRKFARSFRRLVNATNAKLATRLSESTISITNPKILIVALTQFDLLGAWTAQRALAMLGYKALISSSVVKFTKSALSADHYSVIALSVSRPQNAAVQSQLRRMLRHSKRQASITLLFWGNVAYCDYLKANVSDGPSILNFMSSLKEFVQAALIQKPSKQAASEVIFQDRAPETPSSRACP